MSEPEPDENYLKQKEDFLDFCDQHESESNDNNDNNDDSKDKYYLCNYMHHYIPTFKIEDKKIELECFCQRKKDILYEEIPKLLIKNIGKNIDISKYYKCQKLEHRNKKFRYFCKNCKEHLCKLCFEKDNHPNTHEFVIFDFILSEAQNLAKQIKNKLELDSIKKKIDNNLIELFNIIYNNFLDHKYHYSYIVIINEYNRYLKGFQ